MTAEANASVPSAEAASDTSDDDIDGLADSLVEWMEARRGDHAATGTNDDDASEPPIAAVVDPDGDVLTVEEVAALLKVGRNAIYDAVGRREIPHARIGKQIRFSRAAIVRWLSSCEAADKEHR